MRQRSCQIIRQLRAHAPHHPLDQHPHLHDHHLAPFRAVGREGVEQTLLHRLHAGRTELFGALAHVSRASIERTVDDLLASGELVVELRDGYRMLRLAHEQEDTGY